VDEAEGFVPQGQGIPVGHGHDDLFVQFEQIDQHALGLGGADHLGPGKPLQHPGDGPGVVLLGMLGDHEVDPGHPFELGHQALGHGRIDGVHQNGLVAARDQVGVVGGAVGQRNQGVEKAPVPIHGAQPVNLSRQLSFLRGMSPLFSAS
jgi:hypothetical protein